MQNMIRFLLFPRFLSQSEIPRSAHIAPVVFGSNHSSHVFRCLYVYCSFCAISKASNHFAHNNHSKFWIYLLSATDRSCNVFLRTGHRGPNVVRSITMYFGVGAQGNNSSNRLALVTWCLLTFGYIFTYFCEGKYLPVPSCSLQLLYLDLCWGGHTSPPPPFNLGIQTGWLIDWFFLLNIFFYLFYLQVHWFISTFLQMYPVFQIA